jgi:hypothetical protein
MRKNDIIRVGDRFEYGDHVLEVIGTKPGGKVELFDRERNRFLDSWHRIVKTWPRITAPKTPWHVAPGRIDLQGTDEPVPLDD